MIADKQIGVLKYQTGSKDSHGNPVPSWASAVATPVYGWGPRSLDGSAEPYKPNRNLVFRGLTVLGPRGLAQAVTALDRVEVPLGGDAYEVDGDPNDWNQGPFGYHPGDTINLKRPEG